MGRINFRDAYEFDPYGAEDAGGLLGMLQAMMQQGQVESRADLNFRNPGYETPTVLQTSDYGQTPPTRITVRPFDAYSPSDSETHGGEGGLLGRLLALQAEQSRDQPTPVNSGPTPSAPQNPNFRQLSRAPATVRLQGATDPSYRQDDQSSPSYSSFADSALLDLLSTSRQGDETVQPAHSLSDRLQAYWDHPHPYGLVSMLKEVLNGMEQAAQASIDATSVPSTEEEAFRQNQGRELGPIGAWKAMSLLAPMTPGRAGGILVRPLVDRLRNGLPQLPVGARITSQGIQGQIARTSAPPLRFFPGNRNLSPEVQSSPGLANGMATPASVGPANLTQASPRGYGGFGAYGDKPAPPWITTAPTMKTNWPGLQGGGTLAPPIGPMPLPPIPVPRFPDWWKTGSNILQLLDSGSFGKGGGAGGAEFQRCMRAAGGSPEQWEAFCDSLGRGQNKVVGGQPQKNACWSKTYESPDNKRNWCRNQFGSNDPPKYKLP